MVSTAAVKSAGVKVGTELVSCKVIVNASKTAGAKVDGVVMNDAFDNASNSMSCSIGSGSGWYAALAAWYPACAVVALRWYFLSAWQKWVLKAASVR